MDLKDFTDLGNSIGRRVNDAINSMNFDQLNKDIKDQVNDAFFDGQGKKEQFDGLNGKLYHEPSSFDDSAVKSNPVNQGRYKPGSKTQDLVKCSIPVLKKPPGKVSGIIFMSTGYALAGGFGLAMLIMGILSVTVSSLSSVATGVLGALTAGFVPLFVGGLVLAILGTKRYGLTSRFKKYLSILNGQNFCAIKDLASKMQKSPKFIRKDLKKMIAHSFFLEGHLDDQETCFIGTDEMYRQYVQARDSAKTVSEEPAAAPEPPPADDQLKQVIAEGNSYLKTIQEANDAIYNVEISQKLFRMESIIRKIFEYVKTHPDQVSQLRKFMSYYMPTTEKLVNAYKDLDSQTIQGENIAGAKSEIAKTLDTINEAYEKLYDSMYVDVVMDVSSDIAVLKTLFAQEGLSDNEISGGKK